MKRHNRPMSPHLDIYRWRITMLSSILHRASGAFISLGLVLLVLKLVFLASNGEFGFSHFGVLVTSFWIIWTGAVYYHLCNGIRHLVWDAGHGFAVPTAEKSAKMVMLATVLLTLATWLVFFYLL